MAEASRSLGCRFLFSIYRVVVIVVAVVALAGVGVVSWAMAIRFASVWFDGVTATDFIVPGVFVFLAIGGPTLRRIWRNRCS